jgi:pyrroline-5-carboxylate reductase
MTTPILILGAGRMGGAMLEGWRMSGAFSAEDLLVVDPHPGDAAKASGAVLAPTDAQIAGAKTVLMAVKPQGWRDAAKAIEGKLSPDAVIVSVAAGVRASAISQGFGGRRTARVMPTTACAIAQGTASLFAADAEAMARAHVLFDPVATVVELGNEEEMHAATGVSGSAPAYLYAFIEALEAAGVSAGLTPEQSSKLARSTITGAAALLAKTGEEPADLRRQVASPGGTTEAALNVLLSHNGLPPLMRETVALCIRRSKELAA